MERPTGECPDGEASDRHGRARHDNRRVRDSEPWQAPSEPAIPDAGAMRARVRARAQVTEERHGH
jgi:hypothetical protein